MARGLFRKISFNKMVGAYRSQWKRFWRRLFTFGYGQKGVGWWRDPKKASYNWWYYRTSIRIPPRLSTMVCAMLVASLVPVDATRAGVKAHKIKTKRKAQSALSGTRTSKSTQTRTPKSTRTTSAKSVVKSKSETKSKPKVTHTPVVKPVQEGKTKPEHTYSSRPFKDAYEKPATPIVAAEPEIKEPDENTPKSKPKHENDQYIRKRMIIAGSSYCEQSALDKLCIGTYFELVAEPTNPYDKDAVMLVHDGEKIGYIAKQDKLAFVTCLKLKRRVYGVITDIIAGDGDHPKYELETWFDKIKCVLQLVCILKRREYLD